MYSVSSLVGWRVGLILSSLCIAHTGESMEAGGRFPINPCPFTNKEVVEIWEKGSADGDFSAIGRILAPNVRYIDAQFDVRGREKVVDVLKYYAAQSGGGLPNFRLRDVTYGSGKAADKVVVTAEFQPKGAPSPLVFGEALTIRCGYLTDYFSAYTFPPKP